MRERMFGAKKRDIEAAVESAVRRVLADADYEVQERLGGFREVADLTAEATRLRQKIETLTIEKDRKEEAFARKEREIEHKVGLERKRQEFEIEQAKRETEVEIRVENLEADKNRFAEQMKFEREHLEKEIESLRDLTGKLLERLPSAEIIATIGRGGD